MKLVERISQKEGTTPQQQQRSMIGGQTAKRERSAMAEHDRELQRQGMPPEASGPTAYRDLALLRLSGAAETWLNDRGQHGA